MRKKKKKKKKSMKTQLRNSSIAEITYSHGFKCKVRR